MKKLKKKELKKAFDTIFDIAEPTAYISGEAHILLIALANEIQYKIHGLTDFLKKVNNIALSEGLTRLSRNQLCRYLKGLKEEGYVTAKVNKEHKPLQGQHVLTFQITETGLQILHNMRQKMIANVDINKIQKKAKPLFKPAQRFSRNIEKQQK